MYRNIIRLLQLLILFSACLSASNLEEVKLQLVWKHQFQSAGFYVAKEKGYYQEAGLDVAFLEKGEQTDIIDTVTSGKAQYGVGRSSLLIKRSQGYPVVALAALYQDSPSVLITSDPAIKTPADLKGKRIMITGNEVDSASINSMLLANGIHKDDLILQAHSFNYKDIGAKKTDAMACYLSNEPYMLERDGVKYRVFDPKDYGFRFYGDILFTSQYMIDKHPEQVERFYDASMKGWDWAFSHIEETAKLIYDKYNTQNKSLESLIHEGKILKALAYSDMEQFGHISVQRIEKMANLYHLSGLMENKVPLNTFINPLGLGKEHVKIGILSKRGEEKTIQRWQPLADYLNENQDTYKIQIIPLDFQDLEEKVKNSELDFVIVNTMYYVVLEKRYGTTRIATLVNSKNDGEHIKEFGGVVFTRSDNHEINQLEDVEGKKFGAVNSLSFGGWLMAYHELRKIGLDTDDYQLEFLNTHDNVVKAVLDGSVAVGTVRSDTLERMAEEGLIELSKIKILNEQHHKNFPYIVSTELYPEWPFSKLKNTSEKMATAVLEFLIHLSFDQKFIKQYPNLQWSIPEDYSSVSELLQKYHLPPYENHEVTLKEIMLHYGMYIYLLAIAFIFFVIRQIYISRFNKQLRAYNVLLDKQVQERTFELQQQKTLFEKLFEESSDGLFVMQNKKVVACNHRILKILNYPVKEEFINLYLWDFSPRTQADGIASVEKSQLMIRKTLEKGFNEFEWICQKYRGEDFWCLVTFNKVFLNGIESIYARVRDIDHEKELEKIKEENEKALMRSEQKYRHLVEGVSSQYFFYSHNRDGIFTYVSDSVETVLGYTPEEMMVSYKSFLTDNPINKQINERAKAEFNGNEIEPYVVSIVDKNGKERFIEVKETPVKNEDGVVESIDAIAKDVTEMVLAHEALEAQKNLMEYEARHDALTGLSNRAELDNKLKELEYLFDRYERVFSLILFDIDDFKKINDTYGHHKGDDVLVELAKLIQNNARETDIAGRWGGEEFMIICKETNIEGAKMLAEHIRSKVEEYDFKIPQVTISVGVTQYRFGISMQQAFKEVDDALYTAKRLGKNRVEAVNLF